MAKRIFILCVIFTSLIQKMNGQDIFTSPANYGFLCDEAKYLCGSDLDGYSGMLVQDLSPLPQPSPICAGNGSPENTQWISFVADDSVLQINITFDNFTYINTDPGLSAGIYGDCNFNMQTSDNFELDCNTLQASSGSFDLQPDSSIIIPGNIYYLYIDGFAGAACDFTINVISGVCVETPLPDSECVQDCGVTNSQMDNHGCTGQEETYSFEPSSMILENLLGCNPLALNASIDSIIFIDWEISPSTGFTITSTPSYFDSLDVTSYLTVLWDLPGTYTVRPVLSINPLFATCRTMCECTDDVVYTVIVEESSIDTLPLIELCPTSTLNVNFCGQVYNSDTIATCYDRNLCITTIQEVIVKERVDLPIDTQYVCPTDCFEFNGQEFCTPNIFNVPVNNCDSFMQIQIVDLELELSFTQVDSVIDCDNTEAEMIAEFTTNDTRGVDVFWLDALGDTISFSESLTVTEGGEFTFYVVPVEAPGCYETITNIVTKDDQLPNVDLIPPMLDCHNMTDVISVNTSDVISSISWMGPNGYMSSDVSPTVSEAGVYTAEIIISNGCSIIDSTVIMTDFEAPDLEVFHDHFDCSEDIPVAQYMSDSDIVSVLWTSDDGSSNDKVLNLTTLGNYTLTVTASNGCTAMESFTVIDNRYDPSLNFMEDFIWRCNEVERIIDVTAQMDADLDYQWTTIEGIIASENELLEITAPGIFILSGRDDSLGCVGADTLRVFEDDNIFTDIDIVVTNPLCFDGEDGTIEVIGYQGGEGPYTFLFNDTEFDDVGDILFPSGMNSITVLDVFGCEITKTFEIVSSQYFEIITAPEVSVKYGLSGILTADVNIDDELLSSLIWSTVDGEILAEGKEVEIDATHDIIIVTAEDINGCIAEAIINLEIDYEVDVFYPNVFSPNGDGTNDYFSIFTNGQPQSLDLLQIYDRAGELMYTQKDMDFNETQSGWDGRFNNQFVQPGVFIFMIQYTLQNGEKRTMSGSITVIK